LRRRHRLRADLAHLVDGRRRPGRRVRRAAGIRVPQRGGGRGPGRADCRVRSPPPCGGHAMNVALTLDEIRPDALQSASEAGPAPKRIVVAFGFWIFLLSDIVMFSALFAAYAVLVRATAGGPTGAQLFNQTSVAIETACLLASSYTCGLMSLAAGS